MLDFLSVPLRLISVSIILATLTSCTTAPHVTLNNKDWDSNYENANDIWEEGQSSITSGELLLKSGNKRLATSRALLSEGQQKVNDSSDRIVQLRLEYQDATLSMQKLAQADAVEARKNLKAIGQKWQNALDDLKAGNALVARGDKGIQQAQAEISKGRMMIESGSILVRNSQRIRMGEPLLPKKSKP